MFDYHWNCKSLDFIKSSSKLFCKFASETACWRTGFEYLLVVHLVHLALL